MISTVVHERPGVYSSYDASTAISSGGARKVIGVAARAAQGDKETITRLTNYNAGLTAFGEDGETAGMATILKLLYLNGASSVVAVAVADTATKADYVAAFELLSQCEDVGVVVCDSEDTTVQQALRDSVEKASAARCERIAVVGSTDETVTERVARAAALNSERVVLAAGEGLTEDGSVLSGAITAAAVAGVIAATADPAVPLNGAQIQGLSGVKTQYSDDEIDLLVRGGITPLEASAGVVTVVRGITTRTTTGGEADSTWRELSTILIVDNVIPQLRSDLRRKFTRVKNTAQTRSAIRSQVIVELESKCAAEIIDSFGEVTVSALESDPTVCEVEFSFAVSHGLSRIYLTAHITV